MIEQDEWFVAEQLVRLAPIRDTELGPVLDGATARAMFDSVVTTDRMPSAALERSRRRRRSGASPTPRRRPSNPSPTPRRFAYRWVAGAAIVAVAVALLVGVSAIRARPASAAVTFRPSGRYIIATVTDPVATASRLRRAFAAEGLDVNLQLLPVSPSLVGTVVYLSQGDPGAVQPLQGGQCLTPGGGCPIGLKVSLDHRQHVDVDLGRPARPGEDYLSAGDAFAAGEALHCSRLLGVPVGDALPKLRQLGQAVEWRDEPLPGARQAPIRVGPPPATDYIWSATPLAPGRVVIWTAPVALGQGSPEYADLARYESAINQGC